ncbi:malate:quinone oxidoreductase, partial [Paraburkholderia sp. SIMBA_050]
DLLASTRMNNIVPMVRVGLSEFSLIKYLAGQLMLSDADRLKTLQEYLPRAQQQDWRLWQAGQRVQIIKRDKVKGGVLKLGTEIVCSKDG